MSLRPTRILCDSLTLEMTHSSSQVCELVCSVLFRVAFVVACYLLDFSCLLHLNSNFHVQT